VGAEALSKLRDFITLRKRGEDVDQEIKDYLDEKKEKFGFTPDKEEASSLKKIGKDPRFCRLEELIGSHESLNLVRVGIHIMKLNDEGKRQIIDKIKRNIKKKYGYRGIIILDIGTTGVIFDVISYLDNTLRLRKGHSKEKILKEFNRMLDEWENITIFVREEHNKGFVWNHIELYMRLKYPLFFVFAYGSACDVAMKTIAEMNVAGLITQENHYLFFVNSEKDKAGKVKMSWRFEKITPSETSEFIF